MRACVCVCVCVRVCVYVCLLLLKFMVAFSVHARLACCVTLTVGVVVVPLVIV